MASALFLSLIISTVGVAYFVYGKKEADAAFMLCGLVLCIYPYFFQGLEIQIVAGAILMYLPFAIRRFL